MVSSIVCSIWFLSMCEQIFAACLINFCTHKYGKKTLTKKGFCIEFFYLSFIIFDCENFSDSVQNVNLLDALKDLIPIRCHCTNGFVFLEMPNNRLFEEEKSEKGKLKKKKKKNNKTCSTSSVMAFKSLLRSASKFSFVFGMKVSFGTADKAF